MSPVIRHMGAEIYVGHCLEVLRSLPDESVQCCVTSPPYWGLRDYGHDDQIGMERTPQEYVAHLVKVFREVRRVLKPDGTLWLNLGDSYSSHKDCKGVAQTVAKGGKNEQAHVIEKGKAVSRDTKNLKSAGFKNKDLCMIPARVAIALQEDGWWLRSKITWLKKAPMCESVQDRPTNATEEIFLLSKSERYYYDNEAVKEPCSLANIKDFARRKTKNNKGKGTGTYEEARPDLCRSREDYMPEDNRRNLWNYWLLSPEPCKDAHFATFPTEIPRRAILAGSRVGDVVIDPFVGSGTTSMVAIELARRSIGIELNESYLPIINKRLNTSQLCILEGSVEDAETVS